MSTSPFSSVTQLRNKRVHFIGMGGAGMSGIARIMLADGVHVTGSDAKESSALSALSDLGATTFVGHEGSRVENADLVVASSAISQTNSEYAKALELGIPIILRAQALALLMADSRAVAVAGTHGKTTTTSMITVALQSLGEDPSFSIGGMINSIGVNGHKGSGDIFVAEADESDGSFLVYNPLVAVITNIELDHVDHFESFEAVIKLFLEFVETIRPGGSLVACADDAGVQQLLSRITRKDIHLISYGESESDLQVSRIFLDATRSTARVSKNGRLLRELELVVPGKHNVLNATAAVGVGAALDLDLDELISGLAQFTGSRRRFEHKGKARGVEVIDDYGHHPTELRVVLETARRYVGAGKVHVIFQPHRFSRTQSFAEEFARSLELADSVQVLEIYPASEKPIPGVTSHLITKHDHHGKLRYQPSMVEAVTVAAEEAVAGDLIITMGAGDVSSIAPLIVQALEA